MTKLKGLKAALEAATPGEWENWPSANGDDDPMPFRIDVVGGHPEGDLINAWVDNEEDAAFIALAHNLMPTLLEAIDLLETVSSARACQDHAFDTDAWFKQVRSLLEKLK